MDEFFEQKFRKLSIHNDEEDEQAEDAKAPEGSNQQQNAQIGYARQKVDQDGSSLKIEKKIIQKKQNPPEGQNISLSMFQSKKKLKDKSQQLVQETVAKGP